MKRFLPALLALAALPLGAAVEVISTRPEPDRIVRGIDRELGALFHFRARRERAKNLRFTFSPGAKDTIIRYESARRIEYLVRDDGLWQSDPVVFGRIAGALFACRVGMKGEAVLPRFLLAGMRGEMRGLSNSRSINRANRRSTFLRALLAAGKPVDFSCSAPDDGFIPVQVYQEEAGEILLYAARRRDLTDKLKSALATSGGRPTEKLLLMLDDAAREEGFPDADALLIDVARRMVWHEFAPRPAEVSRREFSALRVREVPELDFLGQRTGRTVPVDLELFFPLLAARSDAKELHGRLVGDLRKFSFSEPKECRRILRSLTALPPGPDAVAPLREALNALDRAWARREKIEKTLAHYEIVSGGIGAHCPGRIDAIRRRDETLSPRAVRFFDRVERLYSGE
ncbi:MAG: hypothetical protein MJ016_04260 [Victivallaceae bacterium]|nr:hypothetical protein [Victivallaceae bacterium]